MIRPTNLHHHPPPQQQQLIMILLKSILSRAANSSLTMITLFATASVLIQPISFITIILNAAATSSSPAFNLSTATLVVSVLLLLLYYFLLHNPLTIYLVDFSCYKPPNQWRVPISRFTEHASLMDVFSPDSVDFMTKVLTSAGQGEETYLPPSLHYIPPSNTNFDSLEEARMVLFPAMEALLRKTNLKPNVDIDILIINCSGFCPSPSLTSIVINHFRIRDDVKSFNLSGMGCGASMLAVDTASRLLQVYKNSNAVVLSTEILTFGWYAGKDHTKLVLNSVFRTGAAAILLTNRREAKGMSKYKLVTSRRLTTSFDDKSYHSAFREEDSEGLTGASLNRTVLEVAGETLKISLKDLGSRILPMSEKVKYASSVIAMKLRVKTREFLLLLKGKKDVDDGVLLAPYVPNFKTVIRHFCLPTSGKRLIKEVGKGLGLNEEDIEPALATLHRFGNQSSSSWWYEMSYMEAKGRMKKGDKVLQLGLGSGIKCNSILLECLRTVPPAGDKSEGDIKGPWDGSIHKYPDLISFRAQHVVED